MAKLAGMAVNSTDVLVSVSGPGITYSHVKYNQTKNINMNSINRRTLNIYNDRDIVPWIDRQEGLTQLLVCPPDYALVECHSIQRTLVNVLQICGDSNEFIKNDTLCFL